MGLKNWRKIPGTLLYALAIVGWLLAMNAAAADRAIIGINCTMKPGGSEEAALEKFRQIVAERSGGRLKVRIFMGGQLGGEKEVLEMMKIGQTQMALTGGIFRTMFAEAYDAISIPFYFESWEMAKAYLEGPMGKKIGELAAEKGGIIDFGPQKRAPRHMTANRQIHGPADIKGLKIRLPSVPIWVDVWKELGAAPLVIPAPDIYMAMKTGQVDAHENSLASPYSRKLWEVQQYIILTGHVHFPWHWTASEKWFEGIDPADQALIRAAVDEARAHGNGAEDEKDAFYASELKARGMVFIAPDVAAIREAAMPAIERAASHLAPEVAEEMARLRQR